MKVNVEQEDGEIVVNHQGNGPVTYEVVDHQVEIDDDAELDVFLLAVPGASLPSDGSPVDEEPPAANPDGTPVL